MPRPLRIAQRMHVVGRLHPPHLAPLRMDEAPPAVHGRAVVVHDEVARLPLVAVDVLAPADVLDQLVRQGRIRLMMPSELKRIESNSVDILQDDKISTLPNDAVIICAGGILPTEFLRRAGIAMETKYGTP